MAIRPSPGARARPAAVGLALRYLFGAYFPSDFLRKDGLMTMYQKKPLTRKQREILDFVEEFTTAHGYAPSFEEIATRFGYASLATVHEHIENLRSKGYIRKSHNVSRSLEVVPT
jgi:DNA-binding MarR family transcriptional regulator